MAAAQSPTEVSATAPTDSGTDPSGGSGGGDTGGGQPDTHPVVPPDTSGGQPDTHPVVPPDTSGGNPPQQTYDISQVPFGTLGGDQGQKQFDVPNVKVPPAAVQAGKCIVKLFPFTGALNDAYLVMSWKNTTEAWVKNQHTGDIMNLAVTAGEATPGPVGKIVTCGKAITMVIAETQKASK